MPVLLGGKEEVSFQLVTDTIQQSGIACRSPPAPSYVQEKIRSS